MAHFITDLVGFTGTRDYQTVLASTSPTRNTITTAMVLAMTNAGWTVLSGPTPVTHGEEYELFSAQSPWYDHDNTPSWYLGGRAYIKLTHPNGTNMNVQVGEYFNGTVQNEMTGSEVITLNMLHYTTSGRDFRIVANPYEIYIWPNRITVENIANIYVSALNIPKALQQRKRAISSIIATRIRADSGTIQGHTQLYSLWRDRDGSQRFFISTSNPKVYFLGVRSGTPFTGDGKAHARRIWQRANDPNMTDSTKWWPFFLPAQIAFPIGASGNIPTYNGFMWDTVILSEGFELQSTIRMVGKEFVNMGGSTVSNNSAPGAIFTNFGPSGSTL